MEITFEQNSETFMILFDDIIHIFVKKEYFSTFVGYYSRESYYICFYSKDNTEMELSYGDKEIWEEILKLLKENL